MFLRQYFVLITLSILSIVVSPALCEPPWTVDLDIHSVPDADEEDPGGFVPLNDDDDNNNSTPDKDENPVTGEDDLVHLWLTRSAQDPGTGTIRLSLTETGNGRIKVWDNATKTGTPLITHDDTTKTWGPADIPTSGPGKLLYVEGVTTSSTARDVKLTLTWVGAPGPDPTDKVRITVIKVDLDIYHGQDGSLVPEGKEDDKHGATTVANLNDTDGDGKTDKDDTIVKKASTTLTAVAAADATAIIVQSVDGYETSDKIAISKSDDSGGEVRTVQNINQGTKTITLTEGLGVAYAVGSKVYHCGRDEVDLMKLELHKPDPAVGGNVTLKVTSGNVKIWEESTKETEVVLTNNEKQYAIGDLPATTTVYVEARAASSALRDIVIEWKYKGVEDTVMATAAWVNKTSRSAGQGDNPWHTRQAADGWPHNPKVGVGGQLTDLGAGGLVTHINTTRKATDGSRYGHGSHTSVSGSDTKFGGRILYEFQLVPANVQTLGVTVDITRQIAYCDYLITNGSGTITPSPANKIFPWLQSPPKDNESPNDDGSSSDEDNTPSNQYIYSWDAPSFSLTAGAIAYNISRNTFKEWVRIELENGVFQNQQNTVEGSRASEKYDWHMVSYLKRNSSGKFVEDNAATSYNSPVFTGTGNGTAAVTLLANAVTEGFTATYDLAPKKWTLDGTGSDPVHDQKAGAIPAGTTWTLTVGTKVTVVITQGATAFANGDEFKFSIFKSTAGKENETSTGLFTVTGDP